MHIYIDTHTHTHIYIYIYIYIYCSSYFLVCVKIISGENDFNSSDNNWHVTLTCK